MCCQNKICKKYVWYLNLYKKLQITKTLFYLGGIWVPGINSTPLSSNTDNIVS